MQISLKVFLNSTRILWLGPLVFLGHDAEEIATMEGWMAEHREQVPSALRSGLSVTGLKFSVSVALILVAFLVFSALDFRRHTRGLAPIWSL